jgi:hypothetical protein
MIKDKIKQWGAECIEDMREAITIFRAIRGLRLANAVRQDVLDTVKSCVNTEGNLKNEDDNSDIN